jgi:translocation and assembly module TamB
VTESTKRRRWWRYLLIAGICAFIALLAAGWYVTTDSFQSYVRRRLVAELERVTGGRAEIGSFHVIPFRMQVEVRGITVRGREALSDIPLFHADHLYAQVKVISFLRAEFGFDSLTLEHPVVHIAVAADGTTNIPPSQIPRRTSASSAVDRLFALSIDHLFVRNGELIWADRQIPLDFDVEDTSLQMDYSFLRRRYESRIALGKVDTTLENFRPFAWQMHIDFSLGTNFADMHSLEWSSGRSSLKASGRIGDFGHPHFDGEYEAQLDLGEAAAICRRRDLRQGTVALKGNAQWTLDSNEFVSNGYLGLRDLAWQSDQLAFSNVGATADYAVNDRQLKLSKLQGKLFSGNFAGDGQVDNWLHSVAPAPPIKGRKSGEEVAVISAARPLKKGEKPTPGVQTGVLHLKVRDLSAREIAASLDVRAHPLNGFHPAGLATGSVDGNWRGLPSQAEIAVNLDVVPPAHAPSGELPVTAQIQGKYSVSDNSLELAHFQMATPDSRIEAHGTLSETSEVHLSVSTSNLEEWRPLVQAIGEPTNVPFRINGNATFNGMAGAVLSAPMISGTLVADDFEFTLPATSRTAQQQVHWDTLAANIQFSPSEVQLRGGSLQRGSTAANFDVSARLQNGQFTDDTPFTARVNLKNVDVASTATLAGLDYPLSGIADVSLDIIGTRANPEVQGHIHASNASAYGEAIEKFDADVQVGNGETALNNIHLTHQDASVAGTAAYAPATRSFRLDLTGNNFDLARVRQIHLDRLAVEGRADFALRGSGTLDAPVLDAAVHARDLTLDRERSGALDLRAVTQGRDLHLTGESHFTRGSLQIKGTVVMRGDFPANIAFRTDHLDLDALWISYLGPQLTDHSAVGGTITMQGPLRFPRQWTLNGDLSDLSVEVEYAKLHNQGPVRFEMAGDRFQIEPLHMVGEGTDVTGGGWIGLRAPDDLDLTTDGKLDLKLLTSLDSNISATGVTSVHMKIGGTWNDPLPHGTVEVSNTTVSYAGMPSSLSEMNGKLNFTRDYMHIDQLSARTGGGVIDFKGTATAYNRQINFNLTAVGKEVRLRYPPGVSSTANAELHWVGNRSSSTVSGEIMVTKLAVTPGFDFGSYLESSRQSAGITPANSPLYNVKLDVAVRTAPELQMRTAVARLSGDADLHLRGSVAHPSVLGRADILEGDATLNGIKFRLERGDITFSNPVAIEPLVNLQATTHVRNYDLDVTVTGTPERLAVNYRSEPPLPKSDIIALLALGRTNEESQRLQEQSGLVPYTEQASNLIINQAINQTVSSRVQKLFGVSRIKIDPQGLTTETNPTARGPQVTIEQQFANNVTLTYSTNVSQSTEQIIEGEYFFTRNISAVGTRDWNGVVSFDVRVRRFKK